MRVGLVFILALLLGCERLKQIDIECHDQEIVIHLETLGEYPTSVDGLRLSRAGGPRPIWELVREEGRPQLWKVVLQLGANPTRIKGITGGGSYRVLVPAAEPSFELAHDTTYELLVESPQFSETIVFTPRIGEKGEVTCVVH